MGSIQKDLFDLIYDVEKLRKLPANPEFDNPRFLQERSRLEALSGRRVGSRWDRIPRDSQQVNLHPSVLRDKERGGKAGTEVTQPARCCRPQEKLPLAKTSLPFWKNMERWERGGMAAAPRAPGRIRPGWACRQVLEWPRGLTQQLLLAPCHSSWELPWEAGAAGWLLLEKSGLADGITLCLCLGFPGENFFQFFIDRPSLLLSISQTTGGYFFIFSCFFSMYLCIINMDQTCKSLSERSSLEKTALPRLFKVQIDQHLYLLLLKETFSQLIKCHPNYKLWKEQKWARKSQK